MDEIDGRACSLIREIRVHRVARLSPILSPKELHLTLVNEHHRCRERVRGLTNLSQSEALALIALRFQKQLRTVSPQPCPLALQASKKFHPSGLGTKSTLETLEGKFGVFDLVLLPRIYMTDYAGGVNGGVRLRADYTAQFQELLPFLVEYLGRGARPSYNLNVQYRNNDDVSAEQRFPIQSVTHVSTIGSDSNLPSMPEC